MLSMENAAADAPFIRNVETFGEVPLQFWQMKTRLGESAVSERIAVAPSGEVARILPATFEIRETVFPFSVMADWVPNASVLVPK
jgi:hypothetical protein